MSSAALVPRLALADLWGDRMLAGCSALGLAAVLALLVVRAGVIEGLRQLLLEDLHAREIVTASNRDYDAALLGRLGALPHVVFLAPRTRTLAALMLLRKASDPLGNGVRAELIPSAPGDPLLRGGGAPMRNDVVVLSRSAAAALDAHPGDLLSGRLTRVSGTERQTAELPLTVGAIAPAAAFARDSAFVTVALAVLVDDYQNGRSAVPADLATLPAGAHGVFAGFRLYADEIESVPPIDAALRRQGIDVVSRASDVAALLSVNHSLGVLFMLVAGLGGAGFLVSLGAGLWAGVERKRVPLALLRLVGITGTGLLIFPIVQAVTIAAVGAALAVSAALGMATVINHTLPAILAIDRPLCVISPAAAAAAIVCTLAGALVVAVAAGTAMRVEIPPYDPRTNAPTKLPTLGFRLVLSAITVGSLQDTEAAQREFDTENNAPSAAVDDPCHLIEQLRKATADQTVQRELSELSASLDHAEGARRDQARTAMDAHIEAAAVLAHFVWSLERYARLQEVMADTVFAHNAAEQTDLRAKAAERRAEQAASLDGYLRLVRQIGTGPAAAELAPQMQVVRQELKDRGQRQLSACMPVVTRHATDTQNGHIPSQAAARVDILAVRGTEPEPQRQ